MTTDIFARYGPDPFSDLEESQHVTLARGGTRAGAGRPRKPRTDRMDAAPTPKAHTPTVIPQKEWAGRFIAVDGEGWDGKYTLLQLSCRRDDLYNARGLSTKSILRYLTDHYSSSTHAYVGFGLNYDFEMWLKDVPDADFLALLAGEEIDFCGYTLSYIPRKMFSITHAMSNGKMRTLTYQDVMGFFQSSFESALKKWKISIPSIITEFKALRSGFTPAMLPRIKEYNRTELAKLIELMEALRDSDRDAWHMIGLDPKHSGRIWYGPGSRASNFLKQTRWVDEHPPLLVPENTPMQAKRMLLPHAAVHALAAQLAEAGALLRDARTDIVKRVVDAGGLRGLSRGYESYAVEIKTRIPASVRRRITKKAGMPLDELADVLGLEADVLIELLSHADEAPATDAADYKTTAEDTLLSYDNDTLYEHMFAAAYYGGRIESAAQGVFTGKLYDYDVNSAYPFAITHLPKWDEESLLWVDGYDKTRRMGMYFVRWCLPEGYNYYPFPFRAKSGNVFFPREGAGWYMSPEVDAALSLFPEGELYTSWSMGFKKKGICIVGGFVLDDTAGCSDGRTMPTEKRRCTTAKKMSEMARVRLEAKVTGATFEKALKLLMNSVYGKTIQQVGTHKFLNTFAASWITSTCRALILRAIGADVGNVIAIMTDGILTQRPLAVPIGAALGDYGLETVEGCIQLVPGVYRLNTDLRGEPHTLRYRGVGKGFSYLRGIKVLEGKKEYKVKLRLFVSRTLAMHMPKAYGDSLYHFIELQRKEDFGLQSKREGRVRLTKTRRNQFLPPKSIKPGTETVSMPYQLDIEPVEIGYDFCTSETELLTKGLSSILLDEML